MPHTSTQPTLYGKIMSDQEAKCFAAVSALGSQIVYDGLVDKTNATHECDKLFLAQFNYTLANTPVPFKVYFNHSAKHLYCFNKPDGTVPLGSLDIARNCKTVLTDSTSTPRKLVAPFRGTFPTGGGMWLCGLNAYLTLPADWSGVCASITVSDHTFIMSVDNDRIFARARSSGIPVPTFAPHDPWFGTNVPKDFKHSSLGAKIGMFLFPSIGVSQLALRLETVDYRFKSFMNMSLAVDKGYNIEIDAIRTMLLQHQMVLDLITASSGGVCVLFNQTCCTYVPDEIHNTIEPQLQALRSLQSAMSSDQTVTFQPFDWLVSGSWWSVLLKVLVPVGIVLLLLLCCFSCIVPLLKVSIMRALSPRILRNQMMLMTYSSVPSALPLDDAGTFV